MNMGKTGMESLSPWMGRLGTALTLVWLNSNGTCTGAELEAGFARVDITPGTPVTLAGYESRKELSKGIHDPLSARAVAFVRGEQRLVFISTDILGFYSGTDEAFRAAILRECGLKPGELFLCAIHTHSAPNLCLETGRGHPNNLEYTASLKTKLVGVAKTALNRHAPVELGIGSGASPVGVNRREQVRDANGATSIVLGRNTEAGIDREVQVLKFIRPGEKNAAAVLFAYATHSTSLGPKNYLVSGDVHGLAEQFLEKLDGNRTVAAGFAGASGDIDPWVRVLPEFRSENGWIPEPLLMATMLGEEIARVSERNGGAGSEGEIVARIESVSLPAEETATAESKPLNVTIACVGEVAFVGWGGEVFNQVGQYVKKESPFRYTLIFTHCNGTAGYVPTRPSYEEGGYEVRSSPFAPGAAERLGTETVRLLKEVHERATLKPKGQ